MRDQEGFDLRVESRFKNAALWRAVADRFAGDAIRDHARTTNGQGRIGLGAIVERETGVRRATYYQLLNLRTSPYRKTDGILKDSARALVEFFGIPAAQLFPPTLYRLSLPKLVARDYKSVELLPLVEGMAAEEPDYDRILDRRKVIDRVLSTLSSREERIIRQRFLADQTLEAIGQEFGVTGNRVMQIEAKALRKLRYPARSNLLREVL